MDATTFSKLGVQFIGLAYYCPSPEKNSERYTQFGAVCYPHQTPTNKLCKKSGSINFFFWGGVRTPLIPQWLRPYFAPSTGAEYCDQRVCLSACPSYCLSVCTLTNLNFTESSVAVARSSSGGVAICYVPSFLWMMSLAHNRPHIPSGRHRGQNRLV